MAKSFDYSIFMLITDNYYHLVDGVGSAGNTRPHVSALLCDWTSDSGSLHLTLGVHNHTSVVFEVDDLPILPAESFPLADDYSRHHLLTKAGGSLLHGSHDKITGGGSGKPVKATADALDGDDVQVLGPGVVGAVHEGCDGKTQSHPELVARSSTTSSLAHDEFP